MNSWLGAAARRIIPALILLAGAYFVFHLVFAPAGAAGTAAVTAVTLPAFAYLAAAVCLAAARKADLPTRLHRKGWTWIGTGCILWGLADAGAYSYELFNANPPGVGWFDVVKLASYLPVLIGVLCQFGVITTASRTRLVLDGLLAATSTAVLSWYFLVSPIWQKTETSLLRKATSLAWPLLDTALICISVALVAHHAGAQTQKRSYSLLVASVLAVAITDWVSMYSGMLGGSIATHWYVWGWPLGYALMGLAAHTELNSVDNGGRKPGQDGDRTSPSVFSVIGKFVPYATAIVSFGIVVVHQMRQESGLSHELFFVGVGLVALVMVRQVLTINENQKLAEEIRDLNLSLERSIQRRTGQITALYNLAKAVNNSLDVDEVLENAASNGCRALPCDAIYFNLVSEISESQGEINKQFLDQLYFKHPWLRDSLDKFLATSTILAGAHRVIDPVTNKWANLLGIRLQCQQKDLGVMVALRVGYDFDRTDSQLLDNVAIEVSTALENARMYEAARTAADTDPVTGLLNHRAIQQRFDRAFETAQHTETPLSVLMIDVDNFKFFNDTYGHLVGDVILKKVAHMAYEICNEFGYAARYGGDEFMVLLPNLGEHETVVLVEKLRARVAGASYTPPGSTTAIPFAISVGMATYPDHCHSKHDLLSVADSNMYECKNLSKGSTIAPPRADRRRLTSEHGSFGLLDSMVTAIDNKDSYTRTHSEEVTEYSLWIAEEMGLSEATVKVLRIAGMLHDVGKIGVPDTILRKPGSLTDEEMAIMKQHPVLGAMIVGAMPDMADILDGVRYHHERFDGAGYPDGLAGEDIPLLGRVLAVPDAFSAMTSDRPYRKGMSWEDALERIKLGIGTQFDPAVAKAFIAAVRKRSHLLNRHQLQKSA